MYDPSTLLGSELEIVKCTRQPGGLRITKGACVRQYKLARKKTGRRTGVGLFGNTKQWSLEACKSCPTGQLCAQSITTSRK